ncbi:MAG TPA: HEAT repeat domain-containing protein, partial [Methanothrix soehngenii]|nr:HEAT repeat domain-containing protein [Methanothrix soehngenii]
LSKRDISESLEALIEALKDEEYLVKSNAMVAIAGYGKQVSDRMIEALEDADKDVRAGAAWVIGELKENRAVAALEKVAKDDYPLARIQAKASLIAMGRGPKKPEAQPPVAQPPEDSPETGDKEAEKSEEKKAE